MHSRLTIKATAIYLGVSIATLQRWRSAGKGPAFMRVGPRRILYQRADLDSFLTASRTVPPALR
jgi:excisionase family DNA binding protein